MAQQDTKKTENKEVENSLLYCIFKYGVHIFEFIRITIEPEDFAFPIYRKIYKIIQDEFHKTGQIVSFKGFYKFVLGLPETTEEDKIQYSVALKDISNAIITEEDAIPYTEQLKELSHTRKLLYSMKLTSENLNHGDTKAAIQLMESQLDDIKKGMKSVSKVACMGVREDIEKRIKYLKNIREHPEDAGVIWTGFKNFDNWNPPSKPGDLILFQARTGCGKTMFLKGLALANWCGVYSKNFHPIEKKGKIKGAKVIIITIEMSEIDYTLRMDSQISKMRHTEEFCFGKVVETEEKIKKWSDSIKQFSDNPTDLLVYYVPENCTPAVIDDIIANNPFPPDLVVIDYIGDMDTGVKGLSNYDWKAQSILYQRIKQIAGKRKCVICSAQQTIRNTKKITDESGAGTDKASSLASIIIAIEQTEMDKLHNGKDSEGNTVEGRLTLTEIKVRSGTKLMTNIIPEFYRMSWCEKEFDKPMEAGTIRTIEKVEDKKDKKSNKKDDTLTENKKDLDSSLDGLDVDKSSVTDAILEAALAEMIN